MVACGYTCNINKSRLYTCVVVLDDMTLCLIKTYLICVHKAELSQQESCCLS